MSIERTDREGLAEQEKQKKKGPAGPGGEIGGSRLFRANPAASSRSRKELGKHSRTTHRVETASIPLDSGTVGLITSGCSEAIRHRPVAGSLFLRTPHEPAPG